MTIEQDVTQLQQQVITAVRAINNLAAAVARKDTSSLIDVKSAPLPRGLLLVPFLVGDLLSLTASLTLRLSTSGTLQPRCLLQEPLN